MKKRISLILALLLVFSLCFNGVSAVASIAKTKAETTSIDLPEEIKKSKWFKQGQSEGLYSHFTEWPLVGKSYLGESIEGLILMSEEIEVFDLKTFLGSSVCNIYTIEDFKQFKKQGMKTLTDVYEQVYLNNTPTIFRSVLRNSNITVPSVGAQQWGTITVTASKMYENSDAPALVGAFRNAGIIKDWYISLFNITLSDFGGEFAWLNGKTFNSIGNNALLGGDLSSFIRCLSPKKAAPSATMKTSALVKIETLDEPGGKIKVSINSQSFGSGYQAIGGPIWLEYTFPEPAPKTGYVKIHKASSATNITSGNSNYSVKGSKFSVYSATSNFTYDDLIKYAQGGANTHGFKWYGNFITLADGTAREQAYVDDGYEYVDEPETGSILAKKENNKDYYWYYNKNNSLINLPVGSNYYLIEEFTPSLYGYTNNNTIKQFTVTENNTTNNPIIVTFTNTPTLDPVHIIARKVDKENRLGKGLAGAEFTVKFYPVLADSEADLKGLTPKYTWTLTTDADGFATIDYNKLPSVTYVDGEVRHGLPAGTVTIQETKAPTGFVIDNTVYLAKVMPGSSVGVSTYNPPLIENEVIKSQIELVKEDATTGKVIPLPDTEFQIKSAAGNIVATLKTDATGKCLLPEALKVGDYEVIELKAPYGYLLNTTPVKFSVTATTDLTKPLQVRIADNPAMGRILIDKTGEIYVGTETEEHPLIGTVHKAKFQEWGQISGAKFEVVAANDIVTPDGTVRHKAGEVVDTIITTENDDYSKNLYLDKYIVREKEAAPGYVKDTKEYPVELKYADQHTAVVTEKVSIDNRWLNAKVDVTKEAQELIVVEDKNTVKTVINVKAGEGFLFALYVDEDIKDIKKDSAVAYGTTDADGKLTLEGKFLHGKYYLKEIYTNTAFKPNDTKYPVDLTYDPASTKIEVAHKLLNELITTEVTIDKKDITGENPVPGAEIEIIDKDGNVIYKEVTDENGQIPNISISKPGKYVFKETLAPSRFALNPNTYEFTVNEDGSITGDTSIKNDYTRIEILKVDENSRPLAGVEFTMFDKDGNAVITAISDANGLVKFEGFEHGEYIIKETKTLEGYQLSGEVIELNVDGTYVNSVEPIEFVNYKTPGPPDNPKTGDGTNIMLYIGLMILSFSTIFIVYKVKKV